MSSIEIVGRFRARLADVADEPTRANAPLAITLGAIVCLLSFVLVGPLVSRGSADDAGVLSFLLGESARRSPAARSVHAAAHQDYAALARPFYDGIAQSPAPFAARMPGARKPLQARFSILTRRPHKLARSPATTIVAINLPTRPGLLDKQPLSLSPLTDETLRRGDAIMTARGLRIFQGARHYPFQVADFRPLAFAGSIPHRGALLAIDRVARQPTWRATFSPASPVSAITRVPAGGDSAIRVVETMRRS